MDRRSNMAGGLILIVLGIIFLAQQLMPSLFNRIFGGWFSWPLLIVAVGGIFLATAILSRTGPLAIPGCIVGGIGLILLYQNATGNWDSWSYTWPLIPGFVGLGLLLSGFISPENRNERKSGLGLMAGGFIGFLIFWGFFSFSMDRLWPVLLIAAGIYILGKNLLGKR